jgi:predicted nucleic acid-binding protein
MARILLDSSVLIDLLRGRPAADRLRQLRRQGDEAWVCAVSVEEIWRGIRAGEERVTLRLLRGLRLAPLGVEQGVLAGSWRRQFSTKGVTLHQADCLIAAAAVGVGARLATGNPSDFPMGDLPMGDLIVESWPPGS